MWLLWIIILSVKKRKFVICCLSKNAYLQNVNKMRTSIEELRKIREQYLFQKKLSWLFKILIFMNHDNHSFDNHGSFWLLPEINLITLDLTFLIQIVLIIDLITFVFNILDCEESGASQNQRLVWSQFCSESFQTKEIFPKWYLRNVITF